MNSSKTPIQEACDAIASVKIQDVCDALASVKIRAMWPRAEDDEIAAALVGGVYYEQLAQLSVALGTMEIYVDVEHGASGSAGVPGRDHVVLRIKRPA